MPDNSKDKDKSHSSKKKPYRPPQLTNFGLVRELTTGGSGQFQESMMTGGMMNTMRFP